MGVGRHEGLGVRQLAAALFLCANSVPGTRSAWRTKQCVCPHISIRGLPPQTSAAADWNNGQFTGHAAIRGQNPNIEPVTLFGSTPRQRACHFIKLTPTVRAFVTALLVATEADTDELTKLAA
ncbi:MAG: hypothetical protein GX456_03020 [Verrucomicrobia bacterium]|nr:hypothetical protein [Verrucomicrobiota bacterium]